MTIPGPVIRVSISPPARGVPTDSGVAFMVGITERGDTAHPISITNMTDHQNYLGARVTYGAIYDALDAFFHEGGRQAYIARVTGPAPVVGTVILQDSTPTNTLRINAANAGTWGNTLSVQVVAGPTTGYVLVILDNSNANAEIERSPELFTKADAVAWSATDLYVRAVDLGTGNAPAVHAAVALTGGTDDHLNAIDANWQTALDMLTKDFGPGQVLAPGQTTAARQAQLLQHAVDKNRVALLSAVDSNSVSSLTAAATAARTANARYGALFAPWVNIPGLTAGTLRAISPDAVMAGIIARSDGLGNSPNVAAAGNNGQSLYAVSLTQPNFTDAQRGQLNDGNVNLLRTMFGGVRAYGYRTLVAYNTSPDLIELTNARMLMEIQALGNQIAENHQFNQIDGQGIEFAAYSGELKAMLAPYWEDGSLYGTTPQEAFAVDVSSAVNTPTTIQNREIHARVSLRLSHYGEIVYLDIVKVPTTQAVA